ncbi:hypothetical protein HNQ04_002395 [Deinococcus radiopugnans ATCC 19172]|uniref:Uncharacterized protein n=1 Tax=Deinococcus radiopugnans ATCC 19172 TaxID=585398 RepID=A0ABR6NSX8_9DEIO|nr:hypothetical protein [Deinococcus radiopugnans ATCC 19172]
MIDDYSDLKREKKIDCIIKGKNRPALGAGFSASMTQS